MGETYNKSVGSVGYMFFVYALMMGQTGWAVWFLLGAFWCFGTNGD